MLFKHDRMPSMPGSWAHFFIGFCFVFFSWVKQKNKPRFCQFTIFGWKMRTWFFAWTSFMPAAEYADSNNVTFSLHMKEGKRIKNNLIKFNGRIVASNEVLSKEPPESYKNINFKHKRYRFKRRNPSTLYATWFS